MDNFRSCFVTDQVREIFGLNFEICPKLVALGAVKITKQGTKRRSILRIDLWMEIYIHFGNLKGLSTN